MAATVEPLRDTYSAEFDLGLVPWTDGSAATDNRAILIDAAANAWHGGSFDFASGGTGPVLKPISFDGKGFYLDGEIDLSDRVGFRMQGACGAGHKRTEGDFDTNPIGTVGGMSSRLICTNADSCDYFFRFPGGGYEVERLQFWGKRTAGATRCPVGLQFLGVQEPPSGRHVIRNVQLYDFDVAIDALGTDAGSGSVENHADLCLFDSLGVQNCPIFYQSNNNQSVGHLFIHPFIEGPCTCFNIKRGGLVTVIQPVLNGEQFTLLQVTDGMGANANRFDCIGLEWDHSIDDASNFLTLFKNAGASSDRWWVRISGHITNPHLNYDHTLLWDAGDSPTDTILFDIANIPTLNLTSVGAGWYTPRVDDEELFASSHLAAGATGTRL